jgi:restriction system protein
MLWHLMPGIQHMVGAFFFLFVILLLVTLGNSPYVKGKLGELKVSSLLQKHLKPPTYQVLDDITVPSVNGTTQVDHIVVSQYGIFVIETKNFKGWIFGNARDKYWTQTTLGNKSRFLNPIRQNYAHVKALEAATGLSESVFHSIVVFVGSAKFKTSIPDGVCRLAVLVERIKLKGQRLLSPAEVIAAAQAIKSGRLEPGFKTDYEHVKQLGERFEGSVQKGLSQGLSQGVKQLVFVGGMKLIGIVVMIAIIILAYNHIQSTISNFAISKQPPQTQQSRLQVKSSNPTVRTSTVQSKSTVQSMNRLQQQSSEAALAQLQWETSLRCGYSIDTNRCACYDRKGVKAKVEFERCKELATGEQN